MRIQRSVLKRMQFALISRSFPCISARFKIIDAQGVAARINMLALNEAGSGKNSTQTYAKSGKTMSFPIHAKYTKLLVKSFLKSIVARRIPRMNMHMGVVILPRSPMLSFKTSGSQFDAPKRYSGKATRKEIAVGLTSAALTEIYFLSCVRQ